MLASDVGPGRTKAAELVPNPAKNDLIPTDEDRVPRTNVPDPRGVGDPTQRVDDIIQVLRKGTHNFPRAE